MNNNGHGTIRPERDSIHRSISDYQLELDSALTIKATTAGSDNLYLQVNSKLLFTSHYTTTYMQKQAKRFT